MRQDEAGRWVSDNGRYLWDGSEWVDLEQQEGPASSASAATGADDSASAHTPAGHTPAGHTPAPHRRPHRRRRGLVLVGLVVLVAVGVVAVILIGNRSSSRPKSAAPAPAPGQASPGGLASPPTTVQALDESQRRDRAERALVRRTDIPGATEERTADPTDVFLPCRAVPLTPTAGTVLVGQTVSNSDFTRYVGQTVAGYPSARAAADALAQVKDAISKCEPYDYHYVNSPRIDRITHSDVGAPLDIADGGVYLTETDTPSNYTGSPTSYSYGYVQRGQFLVRLTLTNDSRADRPSLEALMQRLLIPLG